MDDPKDPRRAANPWLGASPSSAGTTEFSRLINAEAYQRAEDHIRRMIANYPYEARFKKNLAWCLARQGKEREAWDWIKVAVMQDPADREAWDLFKHIQETVGEAPIEEVDS